MKSVLLPAGGEKNALHRSGERFGVTCADRKKASSSIARTRARAFAWNGDQDFPIATKN
jgi:hypothetical protein